MSESNTITIQGESFSVDMPYSEGHVCTSTQAGALNQTRAENLRNNFASSVKKAAAAADEAGEDPGW